MFEFTFNGMVRHGFGFCNPNHAAALFCALAPFCWGWRRCAWAGYAAFAVLCVALALTRSRTGTVVLALETIAWVVMDRRNVCEGLRAGRVRVLSAFVLAVAVFVAIAWWMSPRLAIDSSVLNRPRIWISGIRLFAANPLGVGFGCSGEIASAFLLPSGVAVRTMVNSHLTLLAEFGVFVGGAWFAFICVALVSGLRFRRAWISFAGLALSSFSSSVFDWHVLFDFAELGGLAASNFILSWGLLLAFVTMGSALFTGGASVGGIRRAGFRFAFVYASAVAIALTLHAVFHRSATPHVDGDIVAVGDGTARVFRSADWSLREVAAFFPDGARFRIGAGVPPGLTGGTEDVWLFGACGEAAGRFPTAKVTLVSPPEFCEAPPNVVRILQRRYGEPRRDDLRAEAY